MREQIIAEIRRIAAGNNGQPPGRLRFERETSIKMGACYGVFWARWSDALAAAGFAANKSNERISADVLLESLANACRHFGKFPTAGELRLYERQHAGFPSHGTYDGAFSSRAEMQTQLIAWVAKNHSFSDVAAILPGIDLEQTHIPYPNREGHVYLIQSGAFYKIGRSDEIERRVKEIRVALPDAAKLIHSIRTDDPPGIEAYWHRQFEDRRANGEWFRLSVADVTAFKRRRYQSFGYDRESKHDKNLLALLTPRAAGRLPGNGRVQFSRKTSMWARDLGPPPWQCRWSWHLRYFLGDGLRPWEQGGRGVVPHFQIGTFRLEAIENPPAR
jgi:hypothetical protein